MRFFDKNQFAGKEIFEFDLVGGMASWQATREAAG